jgi:hypothetical protein
MAQGFHHHFGEDAYGTIGNATTIATADFDGVSFAAIQALELRTRELQQENYAFKGKVEALKEKYEQSVVSNKDLKNDFERRISQIEKLLSVKKGESDFAQHP